MRTTNRIRASLQENKYPLILLLIYSILAVFFCSKMSPLYPINEWSDINLYFNIGKAIANGKVLYLEVFDHKGPMIFFLYAVGYLISNDSFLGMFIIESLAWITLSFTAYYTARLFLDKGYSFLVAVSFLPLFMSHTEQGGSAEEFIAVCIGISLYLFIRFYKDPREHNYRYMFVHGIMWGIVLLTKFTLTIFWIPMLLAIGLILIQNKEYKNLVINIAVFLFGGLVVVVPIFLYFVATDSMANAIEAYITVNMTQAETSDSILVNLIVRFYQRLRFETIEFSILLLGAIAFPLIFIRNIIAKIGLVLGFLLLFAVVFMINYFFYYSIPYYIYGILGLIVIAYYLKRYIQIRFAWHLAVFFLFIGLSVSIGEKNYFRLTSRELQRKDPPRGVMFQFADVVSKEKNPTLLNTSLDEANAIFTLANIVPNVRYFLTPNLSYAQYPKMRDEQEKYIENREVQFVVLSSKARNYEHFSSFTPLHENYELVDTYTEYSYTDFYLYKLKE